MSLGEHLCANDYLVFTLAYLLQLILKSVFFLRVLSRSMRIMAVSGKNFLETVLDTLCSFAQEYEVF